VLLCVSKKKSEMMDHYDTISAHVYHYMHCLYDLIAKQNKEMIGEEQSLQMNLVG
jgi:hypothetical protein